MEIKLSALTVHLNVIEMIALHAIPMHTIKSLKVLWHPLLILTGLKMWSRRRGRSSINASIAMLNSKI